MTAGKSLVNPERCPAGSRRARDRRANRESGDASPRSNLSWRPPPRYARPAVVDLASSSPENPRDASQDASGKTSDPPPGDRANDRPGGPIKYVCFRLRGQEYAADIANVKETMMVLPITRVFLTPPWLSGIINLRGDIVAVIDLALFFGLPATAITDHSRIVICRHEGKVVGIVVDEMAELRTIEAERLQPPPPTLSSESSALLDGVITVENDAPLRVLDLGKLFESDRLRAFQRKGTR